MIDNSGASQKRRYMMRGELVFPLAIPARVNNVWEQSRLSRTNFILKLWLKLLHKSTPNIA